jgi:hypothetical protein
MVERMRQLFCGLHGHDSLLQFERDRIFLKCASCGHESPGWELSDARPPAPRRNESSTRRAILHAELVDARRVA